MRSSIESKTHACCHCEENEAISPLAPVVVRLPRRVAPRNEANLSGADSDPGSAREKRRKIVAEPDDPFLRACRIARLRCRLCKQRHGLGAVTPRTGRSL